MRFLPEPETLSTSEWQAVHRICRKVSLLACRVQEAKRSKKK